MRVTVFSDALPTVVAGFLLAAVFADEAETRVAVVLLPEDDGELTLLADADCADVVLLTLLVLVEPPRVDTLLVNTRSEPDCLRLPYHLSSLWTGTPWW